jgi:DNA-binding response OmpR family regulator
MLCGVSEASEASGHSDVKLHVRRIARNADVRAGVELEVAGNSVRQCDVGGSLLDRPGGVEVEIAPKLAGNRDSGRDRPGEVDQIDERRMPPPPIEIGGVTIDLFKRAVLKEGEEVHLTPKEFSVLAELARHPDRVLTHGHLLRTAWGPAQEHQTEYLRVAIRALRQKLERDPSRPKIIINEPAVGYRLRASEGT